MDSLANYGSDDDYEELCPDKTGTSDIPSGTSKSRSPEADANYDEVQMDMSEESNNNNSNEDDDRRRENSTERSRSHRSRSRSREDTKPRHRRNRSAEREHRKDEDRPKKESRHKYDSREGSSTSDDRPRKKSPKYREERVRHREDKVKKHRRSGSRERRRSPSRERKRSPSRERKRSTSRERKRSTSREKKRSSSGERRRSRSPRRTEFRKRPDEGSGSRYNAKRFDRTSNKMAQLEKLGIEIKTPDAEFVTPQMLLQRSMDEQVQKVKHSTGIELPKYYNPSAMNPTRYADQIQKRRLLWQKKEPEKETKASTPMEKVWQQTTFAQDSDGKVASKFKRLMGIKDMEGPSSKPAGKDILKKQEEMFSSMEQQYEVARTATHTMRGVGLGFGTFQYPR